jgi:hypothetical protein
MVINYHNLLWNLLSTSCQKFRKPFQGGEKTTWKRGLVEENNNNKKGENENGLQHL